MKFFIKLKIFIFKEKKKCIVLNMKIYNNIVDRLEKECLPWRHFYTGWSTKDELKWYDFKTEAQMTEYRLQCLRELNPEHRADCIEAALAAAHFAFKHEHKLAWRYEDLQGGVWGTGDIPS